jgi:glycerophosphodiester phosphodiesterase
MTYEKFCNMGKRAPPHRSVTLEDVQRSNVHNHPIHDSYPTLRELLQKVPHNIGFNVEIKYPVEDEIVKYNLSPVNRNIYLDCILWEIYEHAQDRFIVFSSFDPEICQMLAIKQPHYPVFFLTQLGTVIRSDPRSNSVDSSITFAKSAGLGGLVCPARYLVKHPDVITKIKESGLRVCTWGADNNLPENVHFQKKMGVDGVIVDHVNHIAKNWASA